VPTGTRPTAATRRTAPADSPPPVAPAEPTIARSANQKPRLAVRAVNVAGRGEAVGVSHRGRTVQASGGTATDRELAVVAAVIVAGSEKAAAPRLGLSHCTVKHHLANARS
jgi:DNA-binding NarL/FixJ family response regulator